MKTRTYEGIRHGDWVRRTQCGAQMLLPCGTDKCPECYECDALFDINGRGNTERLVVRNPKLRNLLKDGEYIPSLRQLNLNVAADIWVEYTEPEQRSKLFNLINKEK